MSDYFTVLYKRQSNAENVALQIITRYIEQRVDMAHLRPALLYPYSIQDLRLCIEPTNKIAQKISPKNIIRAFTKS